MEEERICKCGRQFKVDLRKKGGRYGINRKYCSSKCSRITYQCLYKDKLPTGTIGALAEIIVSIDLMKQGYEVFRALSPSSSCDILILSDGKLKRIEVRTGHYNNGKLIYPKHRIKADIIAVVIHEENDKIEYIVNK